MFFNPRPSRDKERPKGEVTIIPVLPDKWWDEFNYVAYNRVELHAKPERQLEYFLREVVPGVDSPPLSIYLSVSGYGIWQRLMGVHCIVYTGTPYWAIELDVPSQDGADMVISKVYYTTKNHGHQVKENPLQRISFKEFVSIDQTRFGELYPEVILPPVIDVESTVQVFKEGIASRAPWLWRGRPPLSSSEPKLPRIMSP